MARHPPSAGQQAPANKKSRERTDQDILRPGELYRAPNDPKMTMFAGMVDEEQSGFLAGCSYGAFLERGLNLRGLFKRALGPCRALRDP